MVVVVALCYIWN